MFIDIHERDICGRLCRRCGACCRVFVTVAKVDSRFRKYLRATGTVVLPPAKGGEQDCCDDAHDIQLDLGWCQHLEILGEGDEREVRCKVYGTAEFPDLCAHYNCVGWAKFANSYGDGNDMLVKAQRALNLLRLEDLERTAAARSGSSGQ